jgi:hypothetical protein
MSEESARKISEKNVNFLTRFWLGKDPEIELRRVFIENRLITFTITRGPSLADRVFRKNPAPGKSRIMVIANGSTCGVSYYDGVGLEIVETEVDEDEAQPSDFPDDALVTRGNALARRILRRRVGGNISLDVENIESVYRPYYVAFYGKVVQGERVRYLPIAADGCRVHRTF